MPLTNIFKIVEMKCPPETYFKEILDGRGRCEHIDGLVNEATTPEFQTIQEDEIPVIKLDTTADVDMLVDNENCTRENYFIETTENKTLNDTHINNNTYHFNNTERNTAIDGKNFNELMKTDDVVEILKTQNKNSPIMATRTDKIKREIQFLPSIERNSTEKLIKPDELNKIESIEKESTNPYIIRRRIMSDVALSNEIDDLSFNLTEDENEIPLHIRIINFFKGKKSKPAV